MLKYISLFSFFLFFSTLVKAQEINVTIKILTSKKEPVLFATVTLFNRLDSVRTFTKLTDSSGIAQFVLRSNNQYNVNISSVNYLLINKGRNINPNWCVILEEGIEKKYNTTTKKIMPGLWDRSNCNCYNWEEIKNYFSKL